MTRGIFVRIGAIATLVVASAACSGGSDDAAPSDSTVSAPVPASSETAFVTDIRAAALAVEAELGGPQEFFEITATPQLTNVFVALDGATTAQPYVYLDGELQPPAPPVSGAQGATFDVDAIDFDDAAILAGVSKDLPTSTIGALTVEGGPDGTVRYVVSVQSAEGGVLDVVVAPTGAVLEVIPL